MKKLYIFAILTLITFSTLKAQDPMIEWQNTIGGSDFEGIQGHRTISQTNDGGYILGVVSRSNISGDKTENTNGDFDYWLIRLDSSGNIVWQNTIGGSLGENISMISQTNDGGYILGGISSSNISGDKTENSFGASDYWVVKTNSLGIIEWDKTYGGDGSDSLYHISQTADGGYILGGASGSNISGNKTENSIGGSDYWVIKLNFSGTILWQNTIGGSSEDTLRSISETSDGGFIIGGSSSSIISGDKTENSNGGSDLWILKLDSMGNILWQNTIGGNANDYLQQISELPSSDFIVAATSNSNISGDKTENSLNNSNDYWLLKLSSTGLIDWQNTIGGNGYDQLESIDLLSDGSYILAGWSNSDVSGDKTEDSADIDYWILKVNSSGSITNQNTIGGSSNDILRSISSTSDGGYIMLGSSRSDISGDKTENSIGSDDAWVIKLIPNALGIQESNFNRKIVLIQNPVKDILEFDTNQLIDSIRILFINGLVVKELSNIQSNSINVSDIQSGLYLIEFSSTNKKTIKKFIKE